MGEAAEQAAGFDLGELAGVTDQHEGGAAEGGVSEQRAQPAGVYNACLVEDDDAAWVQTARLPRGRVGLVGVGEEAGE